MKLTQIANAIREAGKPLNCWNLLIYGDPKTGKTQLAATIAKVPYVRNIHFISLEKGTETLLTMLREGKLSENEASKIIVYDIPDTAESPKGFETIMKMLTANRDLFICEPHGQVDCMPCANRDANKKIIGYNGQTFNLKKLSKEDVVVIDNLTQLTRSILAYAMKGKPYEAKAEYDQWGILGRVLADACGVIQACANTNFICTAHRTEVEQEENDAKVSYYYPSIGTRNFSMTSAGFFSHVVYLEMKLNQHKGGSATTYRKDVVTGSRGGWKLEAQSSMDLSFLFEELVSGPKNVTSIKKV